jgi:hypothetical protein
VATTSTTRGLKSYLEEFSSLRKRENITFTKYDIWNLVTINNGNAPPPPPRSPVLFLFFFFPRSLIVYGVKMVPKLPAQCNPVDRCWSQLIWPFGLVASAGTKTGQVHCDAFSKRMSHASNKGPSPLLRTYSAILHIWEQTETEQQSCIFPYLT